MNEQTCYVFHCASNTQQFCLNNMLMGAAAQDMDSMRSFITPTTHIMLYNFRTMELFFGLTPTSKPTVNINKQAFQRRYPSQLSVKPTHKSQHVILSTLLATLEVAKTFNKVGPVKFHRLPKSVKDSLSILSAVEDINTIPLLSSGIQTYDPNTRAKEPPAPLLPSQQGPLLPTPSAPQDLSFAASTAEQTKDTEAWVVAAKEKSRTQSGNREQQQQQRKMYVKIQSYLMSTKAKSARLADLGQLVRKQDLITIGIGSETTNVPLSLKNLLILLGFNVRTVKGTEDWADAAVETNIGGGAKMNGLGHGKNGAGGSKTSGLPSSSSWGSPAPSTTTASSSSTSSSTASTTSTTSTTSTGTAAAAAAAAISPGTS